MIAQHLTNSQWEAARAIAAPTISMERRISEGKAPGTGALFQRAEQLAQKHQKLAGKSDYQADLKTGETLYHLSQHYAPSSEWKNGRYVLRSTVHGIPVVPPGMTGKQLQEFVDHRAMAIQQRHAKTFVFISLSMPKSLLRRYFATDWKDKKLLRSTIFVLRGWPSTPTGLPLLIEKLASLFPSPKKQPTVEADPILFTEHRVTRVPVVIHQTPSGQWGAIVGDGYSLLSAIHRIDRGKGSDHHIFGRTWKIIEPNLISTIERRAKSYPWKKAERHAFQTRFQILSREFWVDLPSSRHPQDYLWNPSVIASRSIVLPDGQVVVRKGQEINPLRYAPPFLQQHFVIFNPDKKWQVDIVRSWLSTYRDVKLMVTHFPSTNRAFLQLKNTLHHGFFVDSPLLNSRLGVRYTPSLVQIKGYRLQVQVPAAPAYGPPATH